MKVLHVLSAMDPRYGGPSSSLVGLATAQAKAGIDVSITATHYWELPAWPELENAKRAGCRINLFHYRPKGTGRIQDFSGQLAEDIEKVNVVHIHAIWHEEQLLAAKTARRLARPYIFRTCGMLAPWSLAQSRWKKLAYFKLKLRSHYRSAARIHFTTQRESDVSSKFSVGVRSIVEPNGINRCEFENLPKPGTFRQKYNFGPTEKMILFLGRIHPKKGLELLLESFAQTDTGTLVVAGPDNDNYLPQLESHANRLGIRQRVHFVGALHGEERLAAFQDASAFVLPSHHENFGNTVIEALACGTPVIVSDQVDLCDDVAGESFARVVKLNLNPLRKALQEFASNDQIEELSDACRRFAFERFEWKSIANRWAEHYETIIDEQGSQ